MPTETITVKIEDLERGMVLPGGAKVTGWSKGRDQIFIEGGKYLFPQTLCEVVGYMITVTRETPELAPFEATVQMVGDCSTDSDPMVAAYGYPEGTEVTVYHAGTLPKPSLSAEGRANLDWLCASSMETIYERAHAIRAELAEGLARPVPVAALEWAEYVVELKNDNDYTGRRDAADYIISQAEQPRPKLPEDVAKALRQYGETEVEDTPGWARVFARFIRDQGYEVKEGE